MEADDNVTHFHQAATDVFVLADLIRFVVRGAVDVNSGVILTVIKVRLGCARFNQILTVTRGAEHEFIQKVEPSSFQPAVTPLAKSGHPFRARSGATGGPAL